MARLATVLLVLAATLAGCKDFGGGRVGLAAPPLVWRADPDARCRVRLPAKEERSAGCGPVDPAP
jgi:hypothetical protein